MLDIKFIRENPEAVKETCRKKQVKVDIDRLLEVDRKRRELLQAIEDMRAKKNRANEEIKAAQTKEEKEVIILKMRELDSNSDRVASDFKQLDEEFNGLMLQVPNIPASDVPEGKDESENVVVKEVGQKPKLDFQPKDYLEIAEKFGLIDMESGAKIAGARFGFLKRELALLEVALLHFTFEKLTSKEIIRKIAESVEKGYSDKVFIPVIPPQIINPETYVKMARLSEKDKDERYYIPSDNVYLIGSAEHTLGPLHMDQILDEKDLPIRYVGFSTCFRREAGSYGKDTRGIIRVHQFDKIEMESFSASENSLKEQDFFVAIQEYLMQSLKIPYRVVRICAGDMGAPDARQIDIEAWMPSQNKYRETHTSDLMTDFQARRLNTRLKRVNGAIEFVHMNDATAFAVGRTLIAIIENYQQKDGSVKVPDVLQKYVDFKVIKR